MIFAYTSYRLDLAANAIRLVIFMPLLCLGVDERTGSTSVENAPVIRHGRSDETGLAEHVTRPYGNYEYLPQSNLYKDVTFGDLADDFVTAMGSIGASVQDLNRYARWVSGSTVGDITWSVDGRLGGLAPVRLGVVGNPYTATDQNYFSIHAGPLAVDNFYAGYGAIYNDINGAFPGGTGLVAEDDQWGQIVWLTFRASLRLGESISLSLQPIFYWLPNTGKIGWGFPGPFIGFGMPSLNTPAFAQITWAKQVGFWQVAVYDQFSPMLPQYNLWSSIPQGSNFVGDLSPVDRIGRYSLGYGGDVGSYDPRIRFANPNQTGLNGYYNLAGISAYGEHGYTLKSMLFLRRVDNWDNNFNGLQAIVSGGGVLRSDRDTLTTYAGYEFASAEPFDTTIHSAYIGVNKHISPSIVTYGQAGRYWVSGSGTETEGWLAMAGLRQRLGAYTGHMFEGGRRVFDPGNATPGVEDFLQYSLSQQLGSGSGIIAVAGVSKRQQDFVNNFDYTVKYAGLIFNGQFSSRSMAFASAGWESVESQGIGQFNYQRWTYRLGLVHALTATIQAQCLYQYEDTHGFPNYTEHVLFLGVAKKF